jgi:hypothetical protein
VTQFTGLRTAKPRWSEAFVAARSVSKKHAGVTSFQPKSSRLGRRRSIPTASRRCASPGFSTTAPLPNVESQPNEVVISFGDREFSRGRSSGGGPELALDTPRGIETLAVVTHARPATGRRMTVLVGWVVFSLTMIWAICTNIALRQHYKNSDRSALPANATALAQLASVVVVAAVGYLDCLPLQFHGAT